MAEELTPQDQLYVKIKSLRDVELKPSKTEPGAVGAFLGDFEFATARDNGSVFLKINKTCEAKIRDSIKSERRAELDTTNPLELTLNYQSDLDVEFIFIYIRYAWLCWVAEANQSP